MAVQYDPIAKDESLNTTELAPRNLADVLAQELGYIAAAIGGGYVTWTQIQATGTKIATIDISGVSIDVYVPTAPTVNDGVLTIQKNGSTVETFSATASSNKTANISVPTKTSDLSNDSNFPSDASYVHTDNNFTTALKNKLEGIESGAEVNVQSDWSQSDNTADDYIKNKPNLAAVATSGSYNDLTDKPTIPDELADLTADSTHRVVTDSQISTWNGKQDDVNLSVVDGKVCITYTV